MPVRVYCAFNSICVNPSCTGNHHHALEQRELLKNIVDSSPEVAEMKEAHDSSRKVACAHGLRCFEKDCGFKHDLNHDGRKIITKKFNKEWKAITMKEKIRKEIEEIGEKGMGRWDE